jgi:murein DD-endopeptidase MepM/ murein hydrolase activator NlpD
MLAASRKLVSPRIRISNLSKNVHRGTGAGGSLGAALLLLIGPVAAPSAQESSSDLERLNARVAEARSEIEEIQSQAESVQEQIASIDDQAAAVRKALEFVREFIRETQAEIAVLQVRIRAKEAIYERLKDDARQVAVELYKGGAADELDVLLAADNLSDLLESLEYMGVAAQDRVRVMIKIRRLELQLSLDRKALEGKLEEARRARDEKVVQAQHLRELKFAKSQRLARLRKAIRAHQREAAAIAARSEAIEQQLAATWSTPDPAPVGGPSTAAPVAAGLSDFTWPLMGAITSGFGARWGGAHTGIDIDGATGNPIIASRSGTVVAATFDAAGYGYHIVIDHGEGYASLYAHASELYASAGQAVTQGQTIAAVGSTGASTGDHLHFEIRANGVPQDPLRYLP